MFLHQPWEINSPHFTEEKTKAQRREGTYPSPQPVAPPSLPTLCPVFLDLPTVLGWKAQSPQRTPTVDSAEVRR